MRLALGLLCMPTAILLSKTPDVCVRAELAIPLRKMTEEVVKVHVKVQQMDVVPERYNEENIAGKKVYDRENEQNYKHETVDTNENGDKDTEKGEKAIDEKKATIPSEDDDTVVEYKHGSVKVSSKNYSKSIERETKHVEVNVTDAVTKEMEVIRTANEANEVVTKLSSNTPAVGKLSHQTYDPVVVICGIIGGLAAIIGVAGLVMDKTKSKKDNSAGNDDEFDVDVEANTIPVTAPNDHSDSNSSDDEDEGKGAFTNGTANQNGMNSHLWVIGVTLSLTATLFGTLGKVLLKLSHTSSQTLSVKAAATVCVVLLNPVFDAMSYAYAAQSILAPMAGFSVVWNIVLSPYLLNEKLSTYDLRGTAVILVGCVLVGVSGSHDTPTHRSAELFRLFESRIFVEYAVFVVFLAVAVRLQIELD
ncbi:hypothetical protein PsorP6_002122 [Peronosclerospora sorghi]|uniref:Uncharacterized protein n=1 Tax=Peronosclerospora sorghi TaxID=230839 RepID=A0ACC0WT58_9STRA|nr:hypothetical protein PsorP6_002122 [Peronosclerospora sorghi]